MSSTNTIINPKLCNYGYGPRIYWNTSQNVYFKVFLRRKAYLSSLHVLAKLKK